MVFVVANHKGIFLGEKYMKETWKKIWAEVEVSDLGNVRLDIKKIQTQATKRVQKVQKYDEPTFTKVRVKQFVHAMAKKKVICLNTNQWFESLNAACKYFKICPKKLSNCLRGNTPDTNGLHWAYYTENAPK